jgi:general stress protein YciG
MTEKRKQGFAALTPERRREIASMGGRTAQANGVSHRWTSETGAAAGRKGGRATKRKFDAHLDEIAIGIE